MLTWDRPIRWGFLFLYIRKSLDLYPEIYRSMYDFYWMVDAVALMTSYKGCQHLYSHSPYDYLPRRENHDHTILQCCLYQACFTTRSGSKHVSREWIFEEEILLQNLLRHLRNFLRQFWYTCGTCCGPCCGTCGTIWDTCETFMAPAAPSGIIQFHFLLGLNSFYFVCVEANLVLGNIVWHRHYSDASWCFPIDGFLKKWRVYTFRAI